MPLPPGAPTRHRQVPFVKEARVYSGLYLCALDLVTLWSGRTQRLLL